ncbi:sulfurtransferase, partial [Candidatus Poribacteria bacterium]|nr:sulfurtransferase [Candidatus Poribacteria bacterium]
DAVWMEWSETLVDAGGGVPRFATLAELTPRLTALGIVPDREIVCYCQSGERSAQVYGVLRTLGYPRVRNYVASWGEWGNDPSTPVAAG